MMEIQYRISIMVGGGGIEEGVILQSDMRLISITAVHKNQITLTAQCTHSYFLYLIINNNIMHIEFSVNKERLFNKQKIRRILMEQIVFRLKTRSCSSLDNRCGAG